MASNITEVIIKVTWPEELDHPSTWNWTNILRAAGIRDPEVEVLDWRELAT